MDEVLPCAKGADSCAIVERAGEGAGDSVRVVVVICFAVESPIVAADIVRAAGIDGSRPPRSRSGIGRTAGRAGKRRRIDLCPMHLKTPAEILATILEMAHMAADGLLASEIGMQYYPRREFSGGRTAAVHVLHV